MQHLTVINILLLLMGLVINLLYAIKKQKKENKPFLPGFYIKDNWIEIVITLIAAFASLLMVDDLAKLIHFHAEDGSAFYSIHAFVSGIMPMFFLNKIMKLLKASGDE